MMAVDKFVQHRSVLVYFFQPKRGDRLFLPSPILFTPNITANVRHPSLY
jgi:hypothetical protein